MSHETCEHCGGRFRDHHDCDQDPARVAEEIDTLRARVQALEIVVDEMMVKQQRLIDTMLPRSR